LTLRHSADAREASVPNRGSLSNWNARAKEKA
jgi:hypothetical protein